MSSMKVIQGGQSSQLSFIRDTEEVVKFLEFAGKKSILEEQAVQFRVTACNNIFAVVTEEEDNLDYILKNLDVFIHRFRNKNKNISADTLKVYKSRVKSSLEDYQAWSTDPFGWERSLSEKKRVQAKEQRRASRQQAKAPKKATQNKEEVAATPTESNGDLQRISFPIRPGVNVELALPSNGLTAKEFQRLGMFLYAFCQEAEIPGQWWKM